MPRLIRDQDVDTDLPTRVDHDLLTRSHVAFPLPGEKSQVDTALSLAKLARIMGETLEKLYTTTRRRGGVSKIERLQSELDLWARESLPRDNTTPVDHDPDPVPAPGALDGDWSTAGSVSFEISFLRVALSVATIHVHRPALAFTTADPQFPPSLQACVRASATMIRLLSSGLSDSPNLADPELGRDVYVESLLMTLLYPGGTHMLWQAGLTLIFARCKGTYMASAEEDENMVANCARTLRNLHFRTGDAGGNLAQAADVLDVLRAKVFGARQPTGPKDGVAEQLQWNVWDWPMASALELANTLDAAPFDLYLETEPWM
jgi:hypothetical protein